MPGPYDALVATLMQQPALGGAALGALPYGAPVGASLIGGQLLAEGNPMMMEAVFGNMAPLVRAAQLMAPFLMGARRAQPAAEPWITLPDQPRVAPVPTNPPYITLPDEPRVAPAPTNPPYITLPDEAMAPTAPPYIDLGEVRGSPGGPSGPPTPEPTPGPKPPRRNLGDAMDTAAKIAASQALRNRLAQGRGIVGDAWQNYVRPLLPAAGIALGPKYALDPGFRAGVNEVVGQNVVQPMVQWYTGGNTPTPTPTPTMGPTPTPTSAQTRAPLVYQEDVAAMPDGAVFEVQGMGVVQRRGDKLYPVTPTPSLMAGR